MLPRPTRVPAPAWSTAPSCWPTCFIPTWSTRRAGSSSYVARRREFDLESLINMETLQRSRGNSGAAATLAIVVASLFVIALSGCGSSASSEESSPELQAALSGYRDYLRENAAELTRRLERMQELIEEETGKEPTPRVEP